MNPDAMTRVAFVGAGNVGLHAVLSFSLLVAQGPSVPWQAYVLDYDTVECKDVGKGYHPALMGWSKATAAVEMVRLHRGDAVASSFRPLPVAAQAAPGAIREADAVFNGTDSLQAAAQVSEEARHAWEVRLSTGVRGTTAIHQVEVVPPGMTLGEASYDAEAWSNAARRECKGGVPYNAFAGAAQPLGALVGALAVQCFLTAGRNERHYRFRMAGSRIASIQGSASEPTAVARPAVIDMSFAEPLVRLVSLVSASLGVVSSDLLLSFRTPLVRRICERMPGHYDHRGFEQYPIQGKCPVCGADSPLVESSRDVPAEGLAEVFPGTLRALHAPAGFAFDACTRDGRTVPMCLPFREADVPPPRKKAQPGPAA